MVVDEVLTYDAYWRDTRFEAKRPFLRGSRKKAYGDNIYHRRSDGTWLQASSFHSRPDGTPNSINVEHDTKSQSVLVGNRFAYWGGSGPAVPDRFRDWDGFDLCAGRGHKVKFPPDFVAEVVTWLNSLDAHGYLGVPLEWSRASLA